TGSGAIALAIAHELPGCGVTATDTSAAALEVARTNAERLELAERVRFFEGTVPDGEEPFDLVVANLPYVSEVEWRSLEPEVTEWEPREALLAGPDGLDAFRNVLGERGRRLYRYATQTTTTPVLAFEVGAGQAVEVAAMVRAAGWPNTETRCDLAGIERVVVGRR
ncbi:MAG TPA: HemK/PrmC family methyltransferase, partial [Solirubrobacterales bacterium]|nr:HemK/PrmC family methyltransferase [Solirubrobacterales bacterium]